MQRLGGDGMTEDATMSGAAGNPPDMGMAPGGPRALANGCVCSVLANSAYRAGAAEGPCVDPRCPMHADGVTAPLT
jgi:hypothetical protein